MSVNTLLNGVSQF